MLVVGACCGLLLTRTVLSTKSKCKSLSYWKVMCFMSWLHESNCLPNIEQNPFLFGVHLFMVFIVRWGYLIWTGKQDMLMFVEGWSHHCSQLPTMSCQPGNHPYPSITSDYNCISKTDNTRYLQPTATILFVRATRAVPTRHQSSIVKGWNANLIVLITSRSTRVPLIHVLVSTSMQGTVVHHTWEPFKLITIVCPPDGLVYKLMFLVLAKP